MKTSYSDEWATLHTGTALDVLRQLPERSVHMCVTSPPYWGLRSYLPADHPAKGQELGTEKTPAEFVEKLVEVFGEVWRVLRDDGTCWVNIGDSYAATGKSGGGRQGEKWEANGAQTVGPRGGKWSPAPPGLKPKDLCLIPARLAIALCDWGWYLRQELVWSKDNCMPESVRDRCTRSHEFVYMLTKRPKYFYDSVAIAEPTIKGAAGSTFTNGKTGVNGMGRVSEKPREDHGSRNARSVWRINPKPYPSAHYATFPPELPIRTIKAGTSEKGVCSECGAPWRRVVEKTAVDSQPEITNGRKELHGPTYSRHKQSIEGGQSLVGYEGQTVGWEPTCAHSEAETEPATVLDPFAGSGTTLYAARKLGRRSIGIDIDEKSAQLLQERLGDQGVLL